MFGVPLPIPGLPNEKSSKPGQPKKKGLFGGIAEGALNRMERVTGLDLDGGECLRSLSRRRSW